MQLIEKVAARYRGGQLGLMHRLKSMGVKTPSAKEQLKMRAAWQKSLGKSVEKGKISEKHVVRGFGGGFTKGKPMALRATKRPVKKKR